MEEACNFLPGQHRGEALHEGLSYGEPFLLDGKTFLCQPLRVGIAKAPVIVRELGDKVQSAIANLCKFVAVLIVNRPKGLAPESVKFIDLVISALRSDRT